VRAIADGRVYSGEQAKGLGLVDLLGNMEDAIDVAAKRAGIAGTPQVIYAMGKEENWWRSLLGTFLTKPWEKSGPSGLRYEWTLGAWDSGIRGLAR
jgi:ClpP class serine protease